MNNFTTIQEFSKTLENTQGQQNFYKHQGHNEFW